MRNVSTSLAITYFLLLLTTKSAGTGYAQEKSEDLFVISDRVGELIDLEERNQFELFPAIQGFYSAIFIRLSDSNYVLRITYRDSMTSKMRTKDLPQSNMRIRQWAEMIDRHVAIEASGSNNSSRDTIIVFRGKPLSQYRTFVVYDVAYLIEFGGKKQFSDAGKGYASCELGGMMALKNNNAIGATFLVGTCKGALYGPKVRYRQWNISGINTEFAFGTLFHKIQTRDDTHGFTHKTKIRWTAEGAIDFHDKIGLLVRMDQEKGPALFAGLRLSNGPALLVSAITLIGLAIAVSSISIGPVM